jgi:diguanylate cyclase
MPESKPPSLLMIDVDHFKAINDNHGHLIGDRVIRFVAQTVQKNIKGQDIAARYGGEEFTVLLPSTGTKGAEAVAEAIRIAVAGAQLVRADNKKPLGQITVSAGVATYQPGEDMMDLINRADQALYRAKNAGRNRTCLAE